MPLLLAHAPEERVHDFRITLVLMTLDLEVVEEGHVGIDPHLVLAQNGCTFGVVVEEGFGFGNGNVVVLRKILGPGHPVAVRRLVLAHE